MLLVVSGDGTLMPTAFATVSIVSIKIIYWGVYDADRGLISRDIANNLTETTFKGL